MAMAALTGRRLPRTGIQIQPPAHDMPLVDMESDTRQVPAQLSVITFCMELDILLGNAEQTDVAAPPPPDSPGCREGRYAA